MCEPKYKRYITMGLRDGKLERIFARRGHTPDDIVTRTLELVEQRFGGGHYTRLYLLSVGDEGQYGGSTNLVLLEIQRVPPVPTLPYKLVAAGSWF